MAAMVFDTVTQWFGLAVAALLYLECAVFVMFRHRDTGRKSVEERHARLVHVPLALCLGSMFVCSSSPHLLRWHGAALSAATLLGMGFAIAAMVLAIQSLRRRRASQAADRRQESWPAGDS
jgi:hypothetical protein